jgi:hypothetical protein
MSPNRIVAFLTPLLFAPAAGAVSAWLANHFPGVTIKESDLQAIFIGGALIALAPAAQWLHGWQKYEARQQEADNAVELANAAATGMQASQPADTASDVDDADFDGAALDELGEAGDLDADASFLVDGEAPAPTLGQ